MSEPMDFSFEEFLHTDMLLSGSEWTGPSGSAGAITPSMDEDVVQPTVQADVTLANGVR